MITQAALQWHTAGVLWHRSIPPGCPCLFHSTPPSFPSFPASQLPSICYFSLLHTPSHSLFDVFFYLSLAKIFLFPLFAHFPSLSFSVPAPHYLPLPHIPSLISSFAAMRRGSPAHSECLMNLMFESHPFLSSSVSHCLTSCVVLYLIARSHPAVYECCPGDTGKGKEGE